MAFRAVSFLFHIPSHFGAGEGNRTLVVSLEGFCSTIELHPRRHTRSCRFPFPLRVKGLCLARLMAISASLAALGTAVRFRHGVLRGAHTARAAGRTLVVSLEGFCSTIELHPRVRYQRPSIKYQQTRKHPGSVRSCLILIPDT